MQTDSNNISKIIDIINASNGETFAKVGVVQMQRFIDKFALLNPELHYHDHGSNCICFCYGKFILKIYQKGNNRILHSRYIFEDYMNHLRRIGLPIIKTEIIYEDEYYIAAIQPLLRTIPQEKLNAFIVKKILEIVEIMLVNRKRIPDIYYRNFGIDPATNEVNLFDFHESINFYDTIDLFVSNLFQMFSLFYDNKIALDEVNPPISKIREEAKYGRFCPDFLQAIHEYRIGDALSILRNQIYPGLGQSISRKFSNYQHYHVDLEGQLHLRMHTKQKADLAANIIRQSASIKTILDAGCSYGAIGIYLKQTIAATQMTLNNLDERELEACKELAESVGLFDIKYRNKSILDLALNEKYDMTLFFALVHHLLRTTTIDRIMQFIKSITNKIAIIEFPIKGDRLLAMVAETANSNSNYDFLEDINKLRATISGYGKIIDCVEMEYEMEGIRRYTFILGFD